MTRNAGAPNPDAQCPDDDTGVPDGNRALKLGLPPVAALAFSTLPRWARRMYGRPSGPLSDMAATAGLRVARLALSQEPVFLGAMRAIHRAEWAGDKPGSRHDSPPASG